MCRFTSTIDRNTKGGAVALLLVAMTLSARCNAEQGFSYAQQTAQCAFIADAIDRTGTSPPAVTGSGNWATAVDSGVVYQGEAVATCIPFTSSGTAANSASGSLIKFKMRHLAGNGCAPALMFHSESLLFARVESHIGGNCQASCHAGGLAHLNGNVLPASDLAVMAQNSNVGGFSVITVPIPGGGTFPLPNPLPDGPTDDVDEKQIPKNHDADVSFESITGYSYVDVMAFADRNPFNLAGFGAANAWVKLTTVHVETSASCTVHGTHGVLTYDDRWANALHP